MGTLTSLYAIEGDVFSRLRKQRLLRQLVKVLNGYLSVETLNLPPDYTFQKCHLDKAWIEFKPLLKGIRRSSQMERFLRLGRMVKDRHSDSEVYYWSSYDTATFLSVLWYSVYPVNKALCMWSNHPDWVDYRKTIYANLIQPELLDQALDIFGDLLKKRLAEEQEWLDYWEYPFDENMVNYVYSYFCNTVRFLTPVVYPRSNYVIMEVST